MQNWENSVEVTYNFIKIRFECVQRRQLKPGLCFCALIHKVCILYTYVQHDCVYHKCDTQ